MKIIKAFALTISLLCAPHSYGMKRKSSEPSFTAEFVPQDNITRSLFTVLNQARRQVLIAMYWFMDDFILNKLIELRRNGITIKVIFDESSQRRDDMLNKLLAQSIMPVIFPSHTQGIGKMHNKYVVIDNEIVFTGSANFTQQAFKPTNLIFNYENMLTIYSNELAQQYQANFRNIEAKAFDIYIDTIADNTNLPAWMRLLLPRLFSQDQLFRQIQQSKMPQMNSTQQNRIRTFFRLQPTTGATSSGRPISAYQRRELINSGMYRARDLAGMSYNEAYELLGQVKGWR